MLAHVWTVICSRAVLDKYSNNISLQNVLERLTVKGNPQPQTVIPMPLQIATMWIRAVPDEPTRGHTRVQFVLPSGAIFTSHEVDIDLTEHETHRHVLSLTNLPISEAGRHFVIVETQDENGEDWHQVASVPLRIRFQPED
jgi:hypothetical protein